MKTIQSLYLVVKRTKQEKGWYLKKGKLAAERKIQRDNEFLSTRSKTVIKT